ncbi:hypothetical protein K7432_009252 [Basidiobolus ranarum]|uniref:Endosome-associated-trafficking regulator 1 n=1 Tax=Basidiobolus ranarum TaxID=34480 RepID=A0ABR2WQH9_9FUNG
MLQEPMNREPFSKSPQSPYPRPLPKTPFQTLREGKNQPSPPRKTPNQHDNTTGSLTEASTLSPSNVTSSKPDLTIPMRTLDSPQVSLSGESPSQYLRYAQNESTEPGSTPLLSPKRAHFGSLEVKSPSQSKLFSRLSPKPPLSTEPLSPNLTSDEGSPITSPNTSPGALNPNGRTAIKPLGLNGGRRLSKPLPTPRSFSSNIDPKVAELKRQQIQITDLQHQLDVEKEINEENQERLIRAEQRSESLQLQMLQQKEEYLQRIHEMSKKIEAAEQLVNSLKEENNQLKEHHIQETEQNSQNVREQTQYARLELIRAASMADEGIRMLLNGVQGANNVAQLLNSFGKVHVSSDEKSNPSKNQS